MPFEIITIPFDPDNSVFHADDLNNFCLNKKIKQTHIQFFQNGNQSFWSVFLEYETALKPEKSKETLTEIEKLNEPDRLCFERLREWRNERADKEGIPPYVIANNSHLLQIVREKIKTNEGLKSVKGFGRKKIERYGKEITNIMIHFYKEK